MSEKLTEEASAPKKMLPSWWGWVALSMGVVAWVIDCVVSPDCGGLTPPRSFGDAIARAVGGSIVYVALSILVLAPVVGIVRLILNTLAATPMNKRSERFYCLFNIAIAVWAGLILGKLLVYFRLAN